MTWWGSLCGDPVEPPSNDAEESPPAEGARLHLFHKDGSPAAGSEPDNGDVSASTRDRGPLSAGSAVCFAHVAVWQALFIIRCGSVYLHLLYIGDMRK